MATGMGGCLLGLTLVFGSLLTLVPATPADPTAVALRELGPVWWVHGPAWALGGATMLWAGRQIKAARPRGLLVARVTCWAMPLAFLVYALHVMQAVLPVAHVVFPADHPFWWLLPVAFCQAALVFVVPAWIVWRRLVALDFETAASAHRS